MLTDTQYKYVKEQNREQTGKKDVHHLIVKITNPSKEGFLIWLN
jgi:hypothetical protein